jgi:hypothetical protein
MVVVHVDACCVFESTHYPARWLNPASPEEYLRHHPKAPLHVVYFRVMSILSKTYLRLETKAGVLRVHNTTFARHTWPQKITTVQLNTGGSSEDLLGTQSDR